MFFENYSNKGLSGLANLGNTCFLNSCMQVLSHTYELNDFLDKNNWKNKLKNQVDSALLLEWNDLRQILWNENCIVSPYKFVRAVQKVAQIKKYDLFTGFEQNDLPEFLIFIIDCFHNGISREVNMQIKGNILNEKDKIAFMCFEKIKQMYSKDYSEIWNMFYGIQISQLKSLHNDELISLTPEPYFIINLPIPSHNKSPSLIDCFDLYVEGEILDGDNCVLNEKTNKKEAVRKNLTFWTFPSILVIDIKRFNSNNRKNQILIDFPLENLDLSKYVSGYKKETYIYDLYAVCNHSGSALGGHYTSFIKNANNKWYHFNDTSVSEVSNTNYIITPKAYCFFYRKKQIYS
jgi:ubiquitin carboxyl-terminal hydrolase 2/21